MEAALLILRLGLAAVFGIAAIGKLMDRPGSEKALRDFDVPDPLVRPMLFLLPVAELLVAASMLFVSTAWFGAIGAVALLLTFTGGMIYQLAKGNSPDCHCFGQIHNEPVSIASVARNLVLLALAAYLVFQGRDQQGLALINSDRDILPFVIGLPVIALLITGVLYLRKISAQQSELMRRIEVMELVSKEGTAVEREEAGHPHEGLPIGAVFPNFSLKDLSGRTVTLADIKADTLPVLFFYISPSCTPCKSLIPEFEEWKKDLAGRVKIVFLSNGKPEANREKFGDLLAGSILLQNKHEIADLIKAKWTPTAVLMGSDGRIASHAMAGDAAIRKLIERVRDADLTEPFVYFTNGHGHGHSLKIGKDVPEFALNDLNANEITSDTFRGRETLVTFWSLTCPHCVKMMDELKQWDGTRGADDPQLVVFSDGDLSQHEKLGLSSPIVLDAGYKTAEKFGMFGTPSAVLVNEEGKIASETAIGAEEIWSLVGKLTK